jgi:hypothetical protein
MKCHVAKRCQECSLQACKRCCIETTEPCKQPNHKISKIGARKTYEQTSTAEIAPALSANATGEPEPILPGILEHIKTAIAQKKSIFITYEDLKKHVTEAREIKPKRLKQGKGGQSGSPLSTEKSGTHSLFACNQTDRRSQLAWYYSFFFLFFCFINLQFAVAPSAPVILPTLPTLPTSMEEFLEQLKLVVYWPVFREKGFDELDSLEDLDEGTLNEMGVALGHKGRILRRVKEITRLVNNVF